MSLNTIVNVASVPQRSPFRYPGGKTWLIPSIRRWLSSIDGASRFVEPFAGGATVGLTVAFEELADDVVLVEIDPDVAAVWRTVLNGHATAFARQIACFELSVSSARSVLDRKPSNLREKAFRTILRNRIQHGGILANGASLMKKGENGKGIASRWYPETIARRIKDISSMRGVIKFHQMDGIEYIRSHGAQAATWFIDPPYTVTGKRLYTHHSINHEELFELCAGLKGDFLMTYDKSDEVVAWARRFDYDYVSIAMKSRQHFSKRELMIGRDLSWARG